MENLLQAQDKQSRLYNRGTRLRNFAPGDKVLVLLPTSSSKLLAKWQGPFGVRRRVGDLNYEVVRTDRSGARQIYHLNLLKKWSEVEPVMLATAVSGEDDLRPEVITKIQSLTLAPGGDHFSPSQLTDDRFGAKNRRLGSVLCGLSQGECGVEIRRLSNAAGWRIAWSARYRSYLFDSGLNQRILADPLIALIQRKVSLHNAIRITPICHTSVWVVRGARYLSAPHGQNPPTAHRICIYTAYGAPAGGSESAERGGANGQPKEVCNWAGGGPVSGFPLGSRTGASPNW